MAAKRTKKSEPIKYGSAWGVIPSDFKRIGISYKDTTINFKINPEEYSYKRPQRLAAYKTQNSNVIQQFGADLATITINGTTGYHRDGNNNNGRQRLEDINKLILQYQTDTQNGGTSARTLYFNNYTDSKYYKVTVGQDGFEYSRDKNNPLLFNYVIHFIVIGGDDTPKTDTSVTSEVGNGSGSSIDKGVDATSNNSGSTSSLVDTITNPHATRQDIAKATKRLKRGHGR
jgi:hypothetical protein